MQVLETYLDLHLYSTQLLNLWSVDFTWLRVLDFCWHLFLTMSGGI